MTKILEPNEENLQKVTEYLLKDEIVAIPTETVYGLGANGLSKTAIKKIFKAKNRPQDNPLILHISDYEMMERLVFGLTDELKLFLNNFWPGPLTVIMKKKGIIPDEVSCGLSTVAIRMPQNEIARKIIQKLDYPIAAPSANISGKPSCTNAKDVLADMDGKIPFIVDGGDCIIGIESTVLDLTTRPYTILRPGFYTKEDFLKFEDEILIDTALVKDGQIPKSPGQKYKHYAPLADVLVLVSENRKKVSSEISKILEENKDLKIGIFKFDETILDTKNDNVISLGSIYNLKQMTKILFTGLREFDKSEVDLIIVEGIKEEGIGFSIMNRLKKSANGNIKYLK